MACPHRDRRIGPALDHDTAGVLADAVAALARRHRPAYCLDDPAVTVYLLAGLHRQIQADLSAAVARAREGGLSWAEVGDVLAATGAAACNRYGRPRPPRPGRRCPQ